MIRAKFLTFSRTMEIPRSSEALSSRTRLFINSGLEGDAVRIPITRRMMREILTRRALLLERGLWRFSRYLGGRRRACEEANYSNG